MTDRQNQAPEQIELISIPAQAQQPPAPAPKSHRSRIREANRQMQMVEYSHGSWKPTYGINPDAFTTELEEFLRRKVRQVATRYRIPIDEIDEIEQLTAIRAYEGLTTRIIMNPKGFLVDLAQKEVSRAYITRSRKPRSTCIDDVEWKVEPHIDPHSNNPEVVDIVIESLKLPRFREFGRILELLVEGRTMEEIARRKRMKTWKLHDRYKKLREQFVEHLRGQQIDFDALGYPNLKV